MSTVRSCCFSLGPVNLSSSMRLGQSGLAAHNLLEDYGKLALSFEANQGQTDAVVTLTFLPTAVAPGVTTAPLKVSDT